MSGVYCQIVDTIAGLEEFCTCKAGGRCAHCAAYICAQHMRRVPGGYTLCISCADLATGPNGGPITELSPAPASDTVIDIRPRRALRY